MKITSGSFSGATQTSTGSISRYTSQLSVLRRSGNSAYNGLLLVTTNAYKLFSNSYCFNAASHNKKIRIWHKP